MALTNDATIQAFDVLDFYKYLEMFENEVIKGSNIKSISTSAYKKRLRKILKSVLNGRIVIMVINTWVIPLNSVYSRCNKIYTSRDQSLSCVYLKIAGTVRVLKY